MVGLIISVFTGTSSTGTGLNFDVSLSSDSSWRRFSPELKIWFSAQAIVSAGVLSSKLPL